MSAPVTDGEEGNQGGEELDDDGDGGDDDGDDLILENGIMIGFGCALILIIGILVSYCRYRRKRPSRSILENDSKKGKYQSW